MSGVFQEPPFAAVASIDLSGRQYTFVNVDGNGQLANPTAGAVPDGVLMDDPGAGETGTYDTLRGQRATVIAGANVAVGNLLMVEAVTFRAIVATSTNSIVAKALSAGADGDEINVILGYRGEVP